MNKYLIIHLLISTVFVIGLAGAATAASVSVAVGGSQGMSLPQYVCDGSNDQIEIQNAINAVAKSGGGDVLLLAGTFNINSSINLVNGVNLIGIDVKTTTLKFINKGSLTARGNNNLRGFQATGPLKIAIVGSHVQITDITVRDYTSNYPAFYVWALNTTLSDISFTNCNAIDGWSYGFAIGGEGAPNKVTDITFSGCSAINCGRANQASPWIVGFDLTETTDITNMLVENCRAEGCWQAGFYFEPAPEQKNVILRDCISINNGQKRTIAQSEYGAGFLGGNPSTQFINCTSQGNEYGFYLNSGATVVRGKDTGSTYGFYINRNQGNITLTDCWTDKSQDWAFYGPTSHDVIATNFKVTNPSENAYPAIYTGNSDISAAFLLRSTI